MFEALKKMFSGEPKPAHGKLDPHVAAAALLVEAALVDGVYANLESDQIAEILLESFDLDADRADAVLAEGESLAENSIGAHQFTQHVKRLPEKERNAVIVALYRVSLSDGVACKFEDAFIRHVASLLHVDDVTRALARKRAEAIHSGSASD
mgnify:CR=1 FL=1